MHYTCAIALRQRATKATDSQQRHQPRTHYLIAQKLEIAPNRLTTPTDDGSHREWLFATRATKTKTDLQRYETHGSELFVPLCSASSTCRLRNSHLAALFRRRSESID